MLAALVLLAVGAGGCASGAVTDRVTPQALLAAIDAGTAPVIVDVRTRREYEAGHVPGAIHVPFYTLLVRQDDVPGPASGRWWCTASTGHAPGWPDSCCG